ncbi:hemolymph lipopolysaccharide-binding protein [Anabrus simplex]|uniref:hemolymph lipopolysaccharide-binding protein n=1 Tax=Anabrus simplex TaxID=316456 RepID=UPI0035A3A553
MLAFGMILLMVGSSLQDQCSRMIQLSISTSRNQTGHWHTYVMWDQLPSQSLEFDNKEIAPTSLDLIQRVRGCSTIETLSMETRLVTPPPRAGLGYFSVTGVGRYKFNSTAVPWETARKTCSDEGGHLAVIRSKQQQDFLKALFARHPSIEKTTWTGAAWLGFTDQYSEGDFITVLGESYAEIGYSNWESGRPNNHVYEGFKEDSDCGALLRSGLVIDLPCSAKYAFICEQDL